MNRDRQVLEIATTKNPAKNPEKFPLEIPHTYKGFEGEKRADFLTVKKAVRTAYFRPSKEPIF